MRWKIYIFLPEMSEEVIPLGVIGLTGGIACGKTLVSDYIKKYNVDVIDADLITRRLYLPGSDLLHEIISEFGEEFLLEDGNLDRKRLREHIFDDFERKNRLNKIVHPAIRKAVFNDLMASDSEHQLLVVPLLIETGYVDLCDEIWIMQVDEETQLQRLMMRDQISEELARSMIESQMPFEEKRKYADRIIDNRGTRKRTIKQIRKIFLKYLKKNC